MHLVAIDGVGATTFRDRLLPQLEQRGTVATVERTGAPIAAEHGADVRIDAEGQWRATGQDASVLDTLSILAPRYHYCVLVGAEVTRWPHLIVDEHKVRGSFVEEPTLRDAIDLSSVIDRLEDCEPYITLETLINRVTRVTDADRAGAVATFTGRVRAKDGTDDTPTTHLEFESYGDVAAERLETIRSELLERDSVFEVAMHHRHGVVEAGEDIVFVVVLAGHREEAFRAVEDGINRLKAEVPIFKKEVTVDDEFWVHTRP